jgi:hypothetical protein
MKTSKTQRIIILSIVMVFVIGLIILPQFTSASAVYGLQSQMTLATEVPYPQPANLPDSSLPTTVDSIIPYPEPINEQNSSINPSKDTLPPVITVLSEDNGFTSKSIPANAIVSSISEIPSKQFDAVLLSKNLFQSAKENQKLRDTLVEVVSQQKLLLVKDINLAEIENQLGFHIPIVKSDTNPIVLSSISRMSNGRLIVGSLFTSKKLQNESQSIHNYVSTVKDAMRRYSEIANYYPSDFSPKADLDNKSIINSVSLLNFHKSYLPMTGTTLPYWEASQPIIHWTWDDCPFGVYNEFATGQRQANDGTSSYDFWGVELDQQSVAGRIACQNSNYETSKVWTRADVGGNWGILYKYDPTTTNANHTANVNIGIEAGLKGASVTLELGWGFELPSVNIIDHSNYNSNWAEWELAYFPGDPAARNTYTSKPGVTIRLPERSAPYIYRPINLYWKNIFGVFSHSAHYWIDFTGTQ